MRSIMDNRNRQHGGSLIEALIATAILTLSAVFVAQGFFSNMQARESFRVSRSARKVELAIQKQVAFYFQQHFDNRIGRNGAPLGARPVCTDPQQMTILNANLDDGVELQQFNRGQILQEVGVTPPNDWTNALQRCQNTVRNQGRHFQCALYTTRARPGANPEIQGFVEVEATKLNFTTLAAINNCGTYLGTNTRGFRLSYNIYSFANRRGDVRFYQTGGSRLTSGIFYPPDEGRVPTPTEAGPLQPKDKVEDCPIPPGFPLVDGVTAGPCYNYQKEEIVICNAVRFSCKKRSDKEAQLQAEQQNVPPNQATIDQLQNELNDLPAANDCVSWKDWCDRDGDIGSIPTSLQGPDGFAVDFACRTLAENRADICPVPSIQGGS